MSDILEKILMAKRQTVEAAKLKLPLDEIMRKESIFSRVINADHDFCSRLRRMPKTKIRIIGEIKRASPSRGLIRDFASPLDIAMGYRAGEVDALSVLTDEPFFQGKLEYLGQLQTVGLPLLRKDFIIDDYQLYESLWHGADAVLLIAGVLKAQTGRFVKLAVQLGMAALVEVTSRDELRLALDAGAPAIGVNNRDLKTFAVDLRRGEELLPLIPPTAVRVAESGIKSRADARRMEAAGADALLMGESLMTADNPGDFVRFIRGQTM